MRKWKKGPSEHEKNKKLKYWDLAPNFYFGKVFSVEILRSILLLTHVYILRSDKILEFFLPAVHKNQFAE